MSDIKRSLRDQIIDLHNAVVARNESDPPAGLGATVRREMDAVWDALQLLAEKIDRG